MWVVLEELDLLDLMQTVHGMVLEAVMETARDKAEIKETGRRRP